MLTKLHTLALLLAFSLLLLLTGCIGFGNPFDWEDQQQIDQQIRKAIEKTFPLPEQVVIKTHIGDGLRFSTELTVAEVVAFYRNAYGQKGYEESQGQVLTGDATLLFKKDGDGDVMLAGTENDQGCDVHLFLEPPAP